MGTKAEVLLTQTDETGDEQCCACEQSDRKRDLRADEDFAETLLTHAAAGPAPAFFEAINQVRVRSLQRRIKSHQQAGQHRQRDRETKNWKG